MQEQEAAYWIALAHLPKWGPIRINQLLAQVLHEHQLSVMDFMELEAPEMRKQFGLPENEIQDLESARRQLPSITINQAQRLLNEGFDLLPVSDPGYPQTLKQHLKYRTPPLLYIKGEPTLLQQPSRAIVGSRQATDQALTFAAEMARQAAEMQQVVVSGMARGVDRQAHESAVEYGAATIAVLPQGVLTYGSAVHALYEYITEGRLLLLSSFPPLSSWSKGQAMARNPIIYGLAHEIYVAQSSDSGGTWNGVLDGLKRARTIYVRIPEPGEVTANHQLIERGAVAVDALGSRVDPASTASPLPKAPGSNPETIPETTVSRRDAQQPSRVASQTPRDELDNQLLTILQEAFPAYLKAAEIAERLRERFENTRSPQKISALMRVRPDIEIQQGSPHKYRLGNLMSAGKDSNPATTATQATAEAQPQLSLNLDS